MRITMMGLAGCVVVVAHAAPINDDWANALPIPVTGSAQTVDTTNATANVGDPGCGGPVYQSIWYRYASPVDQFIQARVAPTTGSTAQRPRLSAWSMKSGAFVAADCNADAHEVGFQASAGTTYYLLVSSPVDGALGRLNMNVNPKAFVNPYDGTPPPNNLFWYAEPVTVLPTTVSVDVGAARGDDAYDPGICGGPRTYILGDTLWYRFTPTASGSVDALFASSYEAPYVGVFTGDLDHLQFVACDQQPAARDGATRWTAQAGTTYYIEFGSGYELVGSQPATLTFRETPAPTGGAISAEPVVGLYRQVVFVPEVGYEIRTHLRATVDVRCDAPIAQVLASVTLRQGQISIAGQRTLDCNGGSGRVAFDLSDAKGFRAGSAQLEARGYDFDANFEVTTQSTVVVRRILP